MSELKAHGLSVAPPAGWDVQIYRRRAGDGSEPYPVLHAANFPLPRHRGDFGIGAVERMSAAHALVVLFEYEPAAAHTPLFRATGRPSPSVGDFHPDQLQRTRPGQSGAQWFFTEQDRPFCLYVVMGGHAQRARLLPQVRQLVHELAIDRPAA
jgi:hypothetical protein